MKTRLEALRNEAGVAMMTVILVAAALTAVATASSVIAIQGLRSSSEDWRGSRAESYAEAGLQRFLTDLKTGGFGINAVITAGCSTAPVSIPPGIVGNGTYAAELTVYNPNTTPQVPPSPWTAANASSPPCLNRVTSTKVPQLYAITSTGSTGTVPSPTPGTTGVGRRVIRGVVTISGSGLPVGVYVRNVDANGNPDFNNISLFARGDVVGREKLSFTGNDLYYTLADVYGAHGVTSTASIPAAVHATGAIYATTSIKKGMEHPPNPNCFANPRGTPGQSVYDGSAYGQTLTAGCSNFAPGTFPPTSRFTPTDLENITGRTTLPQLTALEYASLKSSAQSSGIYCAMTSPSAGSCTKQAGPPFSPPGTWLDGNISGLQSFVVYIEFPNGSNPLNNDVKWNASVTPCSTNPALNKSVVLVVRNGSVTLRGGGSMYGSVIAPEGYVDAAGNYTVNGSVVANQLRLRGTAAFRLDACSVANTPSTLINVSGGRWSEIDR
jgi:hypothetical protein